MRCSVTAEDAWLTYNLSRTKSTPVHHHDLDQAIEEITIDNAQP